MRRLKLALLALALATGIAHAGTLMMMGAGPGTASSGPTGSCTESRNWFGRVSGLSATEFNAYDALICGLVTDGDWPKFDALYIFATNNSTTAKLNLVASSFNLTQVGSVSFTADRGFTGDGSTGYLDSGFLQSTGGGQHYTAASSALGGYVLTNRTTPASYAIAGTTNNPSTSIVDKLLANFTGPTWQYGQGSCTAQTASATGATAQGMWLGIRTSASAAALYRNTVSQGTASACSTTTTTNLSILFGARRTATSGANNFSADEIAAGFISSGTINPTNVANRINAYMTALGINVY